MAGQTQQSLAYPGQGAVPTQVYGTGGLSEAPQQPITGIVLAGPSQVPNNFANGPTYPSSPFASIGTGNGAIPMSTQGALGALPSNYSMPYQASHGALHTMASSSSVHTQHLHSTGSSILQALGSGGTAAKMETQQQQQEKTSQQRPQQQQNQGQVAGHGQLAQFGQPSQRQQLGTLYKAQTTGGIYSGTIELKPHSQVFPLLLSPLVFSGQWAILLPLPYGLNLQSPYIPSQCSSA